MRGMDEEKEINKIRVGKVLCFFSRRIKAWEGGIE
jgi:hypothetical protein